MEKDKIWQLLPQIEENLINKYPNINRIVLQLLFNRGLIEENDIESFLNPDYSKAEHDPFLFNNIDAATELIIKHIKEGNKIVVYGDYDADGVTSAAVMTDTLETLKAKVDIYIPDRVSEGYGLNKKAIEEIAASGTKLIITVDGGIRSKEEVLTAKGKLDIIITDHHMPPEDDGDLPDCLIINPVVKDEKYPFKSLAGVGVAFKVAKALISKSKLSAGDKLKMEEKILDLVAIGTVADCVSLLGENRILVKRGLEALNKTKRLGLLELIKVAQIYPVKSGFAGPPRAEFNRVNGGKQLDAWNIGFQIGPRLNAAGRMGHANTAFELLVTKDQEEASTLARDLNDKNIDRQRTTETIVSEIFLGIANRENKEEKIIVAVSPVKEPWSEGIVGLAAGKVCDYFYRPALVITRAEGKLKGSGRSIREFSIIKAIEECSEFLERFGGHPAACGFSLKEENLQGFIEKLRKIAERELGNLDLRPKVKVEVEIDLKELDLELVENVDKFSPFGQNNDKPKFLSRGADVVDIVNMGLTGQHIKLKLKADNSSIISAIGFGQAEQWSGLRIGDKIDIVYYAEINEFNGRREAQVKIVDIKKV